MGESFPLVGLSLGRRHQSTGFAVVERALTRTGELHHVSYSTERGRRLQARERVEVEYRVRHLERQGPPGRYSKVAKRVAELVHQIGVSCAVVVDITATGRPVYNLIAEELGRALKGTDISVTPGIFTVSGLGGGVSKGVDSWVVPRRDLISAAQVLLEEGRLKIAHDLALAGALRDELLSFKAKPSHKEDLEAWREAPDDDLVLAVALACWAGERFFLKEESVPADGGYLRGATA